MASSNDEQQSHSDSFERQLVNRQSPQRTRFQQPHPNDVAATAAHSHFDAHQGGDLPAVPTIPEGSPVRASASATPKSPSPPHSSTTETGTTTTPTSVENASYSGEGAAKGPCPEFPRESLAPQVAGPPAPVDPAWAAMSPMYSAPQTVQEIPYGQYPGRAQHQQQAQAMAQTQESQYSPAQTQQSQYSPAHYTAAIKMLVSNNVAGSIIGRAGQTISELQSKSMTRIKLSQTGDYYPGTQDRVCLVQGEPDNVKAALRLLLERLYMLQEHQHSQHMAWQLQRQKGVPAPTFDFVVRLLVPSSSCGMIIGKSGSNIKYMEEATGVSSVRLSPKDTADPGYPSVASVMATSERVVTIAGPNQESCLECLYLILDGMLAHPDFCRYANMTTSYSRMVPDAYASIAPRPVIVSVPSLPSQLSPQQQLWGGLQGTAPPPLYGASPGLPRRIASSPELAHHVMLQQRQTGMAPPDSPSPERLPAGFQGLSGAPSFPSPGQVHRSPTIAPHSVYLMPTPQPPMNQPSDSRHLGVQHSVSAPDLLAAQLDQSMHISSSVPPGPPLSAAAAGDYSTSNTEAFVPQAPTATAPGCFSAQALVPDNMIGSILGRGGRTLTELQMLSGTRIRISQRGEYMPGTRSRIVSIRGPTAPAVWQAQFMMSQRIVVSPTATAATASPTMSSSPAAYASQQQQRQQQPQRLSTAEPSTSTTKTAEKAPAAAKADPPAS